MREWVKDRELTQVEKELYLAVIKSVEDVQKATSAMVELGSSCKHPVLKILKWDEDTGIVHCAICNHDFGWWCPESKDHYCHYDEHGEYCIYCGVSEERK